MTANRNYITLKSATGPGGFSLVEVVVVMAMFMVVIMISTSAFNNILSGAKQQMTSSESNIAGVIGLEVFRWDLKNAGYGLPWRYGFVGDFQECTVAANGLANGINPASFNDANLSSAAVAKDANMLPRAIQSRAATGAEEWEDGRDYIVIKSVAAGLDESAKKWSYVDGVGGTSHIREMGDNDFVEKDRVITLDARTRRLIAADKTAFSYAVPAKSSGVFVPPTDYQPTDDTDVYLVYGVEHWADTTQLRVPYNRVDYFIDRPGLNRELSARCAPGTGILYKGTLNHSNGGVTSYPLLDCVADMQVVYALDTDGGGRVNRHENEDGLLGLTAKEIRSQLKEIRVYILTHEGQKDNSFNYTRGPIIAVGEDFGGGLMGRNYDVSKLQNIGTSWKNYRWKIYTLVVAPSNITN